MRLARAPHVRRARAAWTRQRSARGAPVTKIDEIGERENVCVCAVRARAETGGIPSGSGVRVVRRARLSRLGGVPPCGGTCLVCGVGSDPRSCVALRPALSLDREKR